MWAYHARPLVHTNTRNCADHECARIGRRYSGGKKLNTSQVSAYERTVVNAESRQGMHKASG